MNYDEAISYIHGTLKFGIKQGLENITTLLEYMGNPQDNLKFVHVGGTNGKGSTVSYISNILVESGYKVGVFISPYIQRFTERMRIGNTEISKEDLVRVTAIVKSNVDRMLEDGLTHPTEFELVTAIAMYYYYENQCDIVVLEVGLGGRLDATNVIKNPLINVITTISFDHVRILGNTLEAIGKEKAGIIKTGSKVVIYPQQKEVVKVLKERCESVEAEPTFVSFDSVNVGEYSIAGQVFDFEKYELLKISLLGKHQIKNACLAIKVIEKLNKMDFYISEENIRNGLLKTKWAGRLEIISKDPYIIIDGAHNKEGALALQEGIESFFPNKRKIMIVGMLKDKDTNEILDIMNESSDMFITVTPDSLRALSATVLSQKLTKYNKEVITSENVEDAINKALEIANKDDLICAWGSLYYIGQVRTKILR